MPVTSYRFEQFLNARSAYGATFDATGDRLYFVSDLSGTPQLWSVLPGAIESWPEPVAVNLDRVMLAVPSSKPGRLVLGADIGGNERMQLYLIDGLGVAPRLLTSEPTAIHTFGGWHPDGKQIVFSSNERDPRFFDVFTLDVETGARSKYGHLSWSTDGGSLYCQTDRDREHLYIAKLDAETGALEPVVTAEWDIGDYALSPDGRRLAYEVNADGFSEIHVLDQSDGTNIVVDLPRGVAADPSRWYHSFGWDTCGDQFAVTVTTATATADVYLAHLGGGKT